jgi:hypothetical protein
VGKVLLGDGQITVKSVKVKLRTTDKESSFHEQRRIHRRAKLDPESERTQARQTMRNLLLALVPLIACAGCMTDRLSKREVHQSVTDMEIRYHEVLFNLARTADDPTALPVYAPIYSGTPAIQDNLQVGNSTVLQALLPVAKKPSPFNGFQQDQISPQVQRQLLENWALDPINVPEKLEAIRCCCQWVICGPERACRDHPGLLDRPDDFPPEDRERHFGVAERLAKLPPNWLHFEKRLCAPKDAVYKARCGEMCAWVTADGVQALADFNLIIQDIARVDINSLTLFCVGRKTSSFYFLTLNAQNPPGRVDATTYVDEYLNFTPDNPYFRWRVEAPSSAASLRTQISAAGLR